MTKVNRKRTTRIPSVDFPGEREKAEALFRVYAASSGLLALFKKHPPFLDAIPWPDPIREALPLIDLVRPLPQNMAWSAVLPDFPAAVFSAERAAAAYFACLPGIREVISQPVAKQREAYLLCKLGLLPPGEAQRDTLQELVGLETDNRVRLMRSATERMRNADRLRAVSVVDVALGRAENGYQGCLTTNWLALGLWMAEPVDVGRWLTLPAARADEKPLRGPFGELPIPDAETVGGWISRLKLHRYQGKGRVNYSQREWQIQLDAVLQQEVFTANKNSC